MNYIIFPGVLDLRKGGPSGYIANLNKGLELIEEEKKVKIISNQTNNISSSNKQKKYKQILKSLIKYYSPLIEKRFEKSLIGDNFKSITNQIDQINFSPNDIIHVHSVFDFNTILRKQIPGKIVFTPHTPESISEETVNFIKSDYRNSNLNLENLKGKIKDIENNAFKKCEYFIFPSKEAMEIYADFIDDFHNIMRNKKIFYNYTGCEKLNYKLKRTEFRKKYNISEDTFVISYIGRHNKIKGFDVFVEVAKEIEKKGLNILFVSGGKGNIKPESNNFIEFGWTDDPGSIINASDLFILPNRNTYFDLVLLEVLSIGTPVLASNTGGNKSVATLTSGVNLFESENVKEIIDKILILKDNNEVLENMRNENLKCYYENFTLQKFSERYLKILEKINQSN